MTTLAQRLAVSAAIATTKSLVNAWTWSTLPLYAVVQQPWRRLKQNQHFNVQQQVLQHSNGRLVYSRPSTTTASPLNHPYVECHCFNQMVPHLDRTREAIGVRSVSDDAGTLANHYHWFTVGEVMDRVDGLARGLRHCFGVTNGTRVILYAHNGLDWFCVALALLRLNAVTVTLLAILNDEALQYGINQSESAILVTSEGLLPRILRISSNLPHLKTIVYIDGDHNTQTNAIASELANRNKVQLTTLSEVAKSGSNVAPTLQFPIPSPEETCLIVYTSGTTGQPKGVMISHRNLVESILNLFRYEHETGVPLFHDSVYASYLPMTHLFGYRMNLGSFLSDRSKFAFCTPATMFDRPAAEGHHRILGDYSLIQPRFTPAVPLVLERLLRDIDAEAERVLPLVGKPLLHYLIDYKIRWVDRGFETPLFNGLVSRWVNRRFFGGRLELVYVSSAPLNGRTQARIRAVFNIKLIQSYGATELTAGTHLMLPHDLTYGECGVPLHSVRYYLKDWEEGGYRVKDKPNPRGEIIVGGPTVSSGYFRMPNETKDAFKIDAEFEQKQRWFETGDIGEVLPNGTLKIIDRKKDLTKLANGEFVSLGKIESILRSAPFVGNICVCTSPYANHLTALISPDRDQLMELAIAQQEKTSTIDPKNFEQICSDRSITDHVLSAIQHWVVQRNCLSPKETPTKVSLVPEPWTPDNGLLTVALKLRRQQVHRRYRPLIDRMFQANEPL